MATLIQRMLMETDFKFACAYFDKVNKIESMHDDRIVTYSVPIGWIKNSASMVKSLGFCRDLINEWNPDLIHIHGTESSYGLLTARGIVNRPVVISLQGLLGPCSEWYHFFGDATLADVLRMHRWLELPAIRGLLLQFLSIQRMAQREREIIRGNRFFVGRTEWDRAYIRALNPTACYFHGGEMLREPFWQGRWDIGKVKRHRIIFTNVGHPRKGADILLRVIKLLQSQYPDIQVAFAGGISLRSGYGRYIRRYINEIGHSVVDLGQLNAVDMAKELLKSHVFVSPSYIENSSNAICEAQLLGMPVISTYTGGIPSLIKDGHTGLFFPTGDVPMLAAKIREIFEDDALAIKIGNQALEVSRKRHDANNVIEEILAVYENVIRVAN